MWHTTMPRPFRQKFSEKGRAEEAVIPTTSLDRDPEKKKNRQAGKRWLGG